MSIRAGDQVTLELFVGEENEQPPPEASGLECLSLRILARQADFRFGGMMIHVRSPAFAVGKSFQVNLDQQNRIASIESYREPEFGWSASSMSNRANATPTTGQRGGRRLSLLGGCSPDPANPAKIAIQPPPQDARCSHCSHCNAQDQLPNLQVDVLVEERSSVIAGSNSAFSAYNAASIAASVASSVVVNSSACSSLKSAQRQTISENQQTQIVHEDDENNQSIFISDINHGKDHDQDQDNISNDSNDNSLVTTNSRPVLFSPMLTAEIVSSNSGASNPSYVQSLVSQLEKTKDRNNNHVTSKPAEESNQPRFFANFLTRDLFPRAEKSPGSPKHFRSPRSPRSPKSPLSPGSPPNSTKDSVNFQPSSAASLNYQPAETSRLSEFQARLWEFENRAKSILKSKFRGDKSSQSSKLKTSKPTAPPPSPAALVEEKIQSSTAAKNESNDKNDTSSSLSESSPPPKVDDQSSQESHLLERLNMRAFGLTKLNTIQPTSGSESSLYAGYGCPRCRGLQQHQLQPPTPPRGDCTSLATSGNETQLRKRNVGVGTALDHLLELDWPDARPMRLLRSRSWNKVD